MNELSGRPLRLAERDRVLFVDRHREVDAVLQSLRHGGNVLLLGDRGSGKTSLAFHIAGRLEDDGVNVATVTGRVTASAAEVLELIRDAVLAWPALAASQGEPAAGGQLRLAVGASTPRLLLDEIATLRRQLASRDGGVVVLDELGAADVPRTLFARLRDELWELPLSWCVAADVEDSGNYLSAPADAFWSRVVDLGPLDDPSAEELLRLREVGLGEAALRDVVRLAEGNPRRLITLARELEAGRSRKSLKENATRVASLSAPAQRLYGELEASGPAGPSDPALTARLGWGRSRASQVFQELVRAGLVRSATRADGPGRPRKVFELISE